MRNWLMRLAWPPYDCEQCVGQDEWQGCYCAYYGADVPGGGQLPLWRRILQYVWSFGYDDRLNLTAPGLRRT